MKVKQLNRNIIIVLLTDLHDLLHDSVQKGRICCNIIGITSSVYVCYQFVG